MIIHIFDTIEPPKFGRRIITDCGTETLFIPIDPSLYPKEANLCGRCADLHRNIGEEQSVHTFTVVDPNFICRRCDEEYIKEKKKLIDEKIALEEAIKNDGERVDEVNRETIDAVVFAHEAMERFKNGSLSEKRTILGKIGSNLTLKGKKLIINAATPFTFLQNGLPSVREEFERIEPLKNEANTEQFAFFWPQFVLGWT